MVYAHRWTLTRERSGVVPESANGGKSGNYLMDREEVSPAQPRDKEMQKGLWEVSGELTNLEVPS